MALTTGNAFMADKAERRVAELEAERDKLRAELAELKAWQEKVRDAIGTTCCCPADCMYCD